MLSNKNRPGRIRINGKLYEAVSSYRNRRILNEDTDPYTIDEPSVSRNWTVETDYTEHGVETISTLKFTYRNVEPLYVEFRVSAWKQVDNSDSFFGNLYRNPGISCFVSLGNQGTYFSDERVFTDDEDGTETTKFIGRIVDVAEDEFADFYELASNPSNTLVKGSKILKQAANSAIDSISNAFERGTEKDR